MSEPELKVTSTLDWHMRRYAMTQIARSCRHVMQQLDFALPYKRDREHARNELELRAAKKTYEALRDAATEMIGSIDHALEERRKAGIPADQHITTWQIHRDNRPGTDVAIRDTQTEMEKA
jgi:hypothetical protein